MFSWIRTVSFTFLLICFKISYNIDHYTFWNDRVIETRLKTQRGHLTILGVYAPTEGRDELNEEFYETLQNSYLFIYNTFIKILYMFRACSMYCLCVNVYCHRVTAQLQLINISYHYPAHLQEVYVVIIFMQPLVSSVS